jgi:hypothetical protein
MLDVFFGTILIVYLTGKCYSFYKGIVAGILIPDTDYAEHIAALDDGVQELFNETRAGV